MFRSGTFVARRKYLLSLAMITLFAQCLLDLRYADFLSGSQLFSFSFSSFMMLYLDTRAVNNFAASSVLCGIGHK